MKFMFIVIANRDRKPEPGPPGEGRGLGGTPRVPQLMLPDTGTARGLPANSECQGPVYRETGERTKTTDTGI